MRVLVAAASLVAFATGALAQESGLAVKKTPLGDVLATPSGMTLYAFTKDKKGESSCYDQCAQNWPPLAAESGSPKAGEGVDAKLVGTTARKDGKKQITYNGMPLYTFTKDAAPGDAKGQGVKDVWYAVSPAGTVVK